MRTIALFKCEYCGAEYREETNCRLCEAHHKPVSIIQDMKFTPNTSSTNYPNAVKLRTSGGKSIWYYRKDEESED